MRRILSKQWLDIVLARWIGKPTQHYACRQKWVSTIPVSLCMRLIRRTAYHVGHTPYITFLKTEVARALSVARIVEVVREAMLSDSDAPLQHHNALHFMLQELI